VTNIDGRGLLWPYWFCPYEFRQAWLCG